MLIKNFDMSGIIKKLRRISSAVHEPLQQLVREQAKLFISSTGNVPGLAQIIPPSHEGVKGAAAGRHGVAVVRRDIAKVYATPGSMFAKIRETSPSAAKAFWVSIKGRAQKTKSGKYRKNNRGATNMAEARRIIESSGGDWSALQVIDGFDDGALHRSSRGSGGRVRARKPRAVITDTSALATYVKTRTGNVGLLASMLNTPGNMLGSKGIPSFVQAHGSKLGAPVTFLTTDHSFYVVIDATAPYGMDHYTHRIPYIIQYRENALRRAWPYVQRYLKSRADLQRAAA